MSNPTLVAASQPKRLSWDFLRATIRGSALPYVGSLLFTVMLAAYANYLSRFAPLESVTLKGQSLSIVIPWVGFPVTLVLWWFYQGHRTRSRWTTIFLLGLVAVWLVHLALIFMHGDMYTHLIWLYAPVLLLLFFKTPSSREAWQALTFLGWLAVAMLVLTRLLEIVEVIPMFQIEPWIIEYEKSRYFLPFSGYFGLEGRWAGPFGYNSKTGLVSVLLIVLGAARWTRSSWVFVIVGSLGLLLTAARGSYLALLTGLLVLVLMARRGPVARIPMTLRVIAGGVAVVFVGLVFYAGPSSTSGRVGDGGIWDSFLVLWKSSIWTGVGQTGIEGSPGAMVSMEAHSIFIQELAKYGLVGFITQFGILCIGVGILVVAAVRRWPGPLALVSVYFVASVTEIPNEWQSHTLYSILIVLCVIGGGAWLREQKEQAPKEASERETVA